MESENRNTQIITSILRWIGGGVTEDELTSINAALNNQSVNCSKFEVRRILDRGVKHGFVQRLGRKYSLSELQETDTGKRKRKKSKAQAKADRARRLRATKAAAAQRNRDRQLTNATVVSRKTKNSRRKVEEYKPRRLKLSEKINETIDEEEMNESD